MIANNQRYEIWLFIGPAQVHFVWGVTVLFAANPLVTTGLADINKFTGNNNYVTGGVLIAVSLLAMASVIIHPTKPRTAFWLLIPQQFMMLLSFFTAWSCMISGKFANGVVLGSDFVIVDQCHQAIIPAAHTALIVHVFMWDGIKRWRKKWAGLK